MEGKLRTKEAQNWLKCILAMYETRDVLSELASGLFEDFYIELRGILHANNHISLQKTCTTCRDPKQGCNLCSEICRLIWDNHRFKDVNLKGPSWNNTDSTKWCTNSWELAKCYMPSTGYKDKPSANITDFNGIINALYNCTWMQKFFADDLSQDDNICTQARKKVNILRHMPNTHIADVDMTSFFDCLLKLLNDAAHLNGFKPAVDACNSLIELQQDTLQLSEKMINGTWTKHYEDKKEEFRRDLIAHYRKTKSTVSISPMWEGLDKPIADIFVSPMLMHIATDKNGYRRQTGKPVKQYKHILFNDRIHHSTVFFQGEPGMGKTTFFAKLVIDWCEAVSPENSEYRATYSDLETLTEFGFLFSIALRDSEGQHEVVNMIKTQIIDMIYTENERTDIYNLLQNIMKRELCIVAMDGLNEWVDPLNKHALPVMVSCHKKCVALISTRPWKMTDERIKDSEIDILLEVAGITDSDELTKKMLRCLENANLKTYTDFMTYVKERKLFQFLTSPWLQTLLVNLWMDDSALSGSLCELNCVVLDSLFKKANAKQGCFIKGHSIQCLANTIYIEPQKEIVYALGKAAFSFTYSSEKTLVFTKRKVLNFLSEEQFQFCLKAGVLTEKQASMNSQISFLHETIQEFLAALHIAHSNEDILTCVLSKHKYNVLELSQTIIYLCGLHVEIANKAIQCIMSSDFFNDVNIGLSAYIKEFVYHTKSYVFQKESYPKEHNVTFENVSERRRLELFVSFQRMMIAGYIEAKASKQNDIYMKCNDFIFNQYLNKNDSSVLKTILMINKSNVRTLMTEKTSLQTTEIMSVIRTSTHCLERVEIPAAPELCIALNSSNIKELAFIGDINASLVSKVTSSMSKLTYLKFKESHLKEIINIAISLQHVCLFQCECSLEVLNRFLVDLSALKHKTRCDLDQVTVIHCEALVLRSDVLECDMSNMTLDVNKGSIEIYNELRDTSIGTLMVETESDFALASDIINTLSKLEKLYILGTYMTRCDFHLPASLQLLSLQGVKCSSEWLCSLLIILSSLHHPVTCELWNVVLLSSKTPCGATSELQVSDLRSEILSCDMSNVMITLKTVSTELFEIFRDTSVSSLDLQTSECVSQASDIIPKLNKLEKLYLRGTYMTRCAFQLPASLQLISLPEVECSSEWLCSLLITLSSCHHPVTCELRNVVLQSNNNPCGAASETKSSDLRFELLCCDMSNIEILVDTVNKELFEIFCYTSISILHLRTTECVSQASQFLHTLKKLEKLYLCGTYVGKCDLKFLSTLKYVSLQKGECSMEWLCELLITLSLFDHPVKCEVIDFVFIPQEDNLSGWRLPLLRSEMILRDMSNVKLHVLNRCIDHYKALRDTKVEILTFDRTCQLTHTDRRPARNSSRRTTIRCVLF